MCRMSCFSLIGQPTQIDNRLCVPDIGIRFQDRLQHRIQIIYINANCNIHIIPLHCVLFVAVLEIDVMFLLLVRLMHATNGTHWEEHIILEICCCN